MATRPGILEPPARLRWPASDGGAAATAAIAAVEWADPATLASLLTTAERDHAESLASEIRRNRYLAGHALLNRLARTHGERVRVDRTAGGRPLLTVDGHRLAASISHAGPFVAAAVGELAHLGIDLEFPRRARAWRAVERRYGWPALTNECDRLRRWSLWEATGKARGLGVFRAADPVFEALWADRSCQDWTAAFLPVAGDGWLVLVCEGPPRGQVEGGGETWAGGAPAS